jgi:hypothetical protein
MVWAMVRSGGKGEREPIRGAMPVRRRGPGFGGHGVVSMVQRQGEPAAMPPEGGLMVVA